MGYPSYPKVADFSSAQLRKRMDQFRARRVRLLECPASKETDSQQDEWERDVIKFVTEWCDERNNGS